MDRRDYVNYIMIIIFIGLTILIGVFSILALVNAVHLNESEINRFDSVTLVELPQNQLQGDVQISKGTPLQLSDNQVFLIEPSETPASIDSIIPLQVPIGDLISVASANNLLYTLGSRISTSQSQSQGSLYVKALRFSSNCYIDMTDIYPLNDPEISVTDFADNIGIKTNSTYFFVPFQQKIFMMLASLNNNNLTEISIISKPELKSNNLLDLKSIHVQDEWMFVTYEGTGPTQVYKLTEPGSSPLTMVLNPDDELIGISPSRVIGGPSYLLFENKNLDTSFVASFQSNGFQVTYTNLQTVNRELGSGFAWTSQQLIFIEKSNPQMSRMIAYTEFDNGPGPATVQEFILFQLDGGVNWITGDNNTGYVAFTATNDSTLLCCSVESRSVLFVKTETINIENNRRNLSLVNLYGGNKDEPFFFTSQNNQINYSLTGFFSYRQLRGDALFIGLSSKATNATSEKIEIIQSGLLNYGIGKMYEDGEILLLSPDGKLFFSLQNIPSYTIIGYSTKPHEFLLTNSLVE